MLVYVINKRGKPLMPCKPKKARLLLKQGKAKIVKTEPFTIQLLYGSSGYKQKINLGIDAGSKEIGVSATTEKLELFSAECKIRQNVSELISTRKQIRRTRRNRLRYRKPKFDNRVSRKKKGWLAPSIEHKINSHINIIKFIHSILPVNETIIEVAQFDIHKIKNPDVKGREYQQGEQLGFWNIREYILYRDGHKCSNCKGKLKDKVLQVHHLESRKVGGNRPDNLITLCSTCHKKHHNEEPLNLKKKINNFKHATHMGIMRWELYNRCKKQFNNVRMTYGYITKNTRIKHNLEKSHRIDARCISGNPLSKSGFNWFLMVKKRCQNRQIHKCNFVKGHIKKLNQAPYVVKGFRLFDKVKFNNQEGFIFGRRNSGYFDLRTLEGKRIHKSASHKTLNLIQQRSSILLERRKW